MPHAPAPSPPALPNIRPPSLALLLQELRVLAEIPRFALQTFSLRGLQRGDGHPVLVLPGFGADDLATAPLRHALTRLGYRVSGWGLGRNLGMRPGVKAGLSDRLVAMHAQHSPVTLIGWSLGGVFARELARRSPTRVRAVFSLGSPISGRPDANNIDALYRRASRTQASPIDVEAFLRRVVPPPVPCTAIYTKRDGIVAWQCCLEPEAPNTRNVEVRGTHLGLVFNAQVLRILAQQMAR